jgi:hypothetical protein
MSIRIASPAITIINPIVEGTIMVIDITIMVIDITIMATDITIMVTDDSRIAKRVRTWLSRAIWCYPFGCDLYGHRFMRFSLRGR